VKRVAVVLFALAGGAGLGASGACDDTGAYPFQARPLDDTIGCLGNVAVLDIIAGADPGLGCTPRCFVATQADEAGDFIVYGTTMCGPGPQGYDSSGQDPRCAVALGAVGRTDLCTGDGGQTAPPVVDAGAEAGEAAVDSSVDSPVDAPADDSSDAAVEVSTD